MTISKNDLPDDWHMVPSDHAGGFVRELQLELSPVHRLYGVSVQAIARRTWNDDMLFRHIGETDRYSVVHLTWSGQEEPEPWPMVEFSGTFVQFRDTYPPPSDDERDR